MQDNVIPFKKAKLFKNGVLIDLKSGELSKVDILVENEKITAIEEWGVIEDLSSFNKPGFEIVDLQGNYVMMPFVNAFCDSEKAVLKTYGREFKFVNELNFKQSDADNFKEFTQEDLCVLAASFIKVKSILAGSIFENDMWFVRSAKIKDITKNMPNWAYLEEIDKKNENVLDKLCMEVNQNKKRLFLKIGQTLDELGTIDKRFGKQISHVLEDFGLLDKKPIIVGGNCLEKDDLQVLKDYDCSFVVTPFDDAKNGRRLTNLIALKSLDFKVGIGSGESTEIDFFAYMRQLLLHTRALFEDKNILTEKDVLQMSTKQSAKISGISLALKVGEVASFIVIRNEISLYNDIFKTLVWEKSKKDVVMTVGNGEILQKNGEILMKKMKDYDRIKRWINQFTKLTTTD